MVLQFCNDGVSFKDHPTAWMKRPGRPGLDKRWAPASKRKDLGVFPKKTRNILIINSYMAVFCLPQVAPAPTWLALWNWLKQNLRKPLKKKDTNRKNIGKNRKTSRNKIGKNRKIIERQKQNRKKHRKNTRKNREKRGNKKEAKRKKIRGKQGKTSKMKETIR